MKNNKKALSFTMGLFYMQDAWYVAGAWMHRSDDIQDDMQGCYPVLTICVNDFIVFIFIPVE
jgi:hypothetical protein